MRNLDFSSWQALVSTVLGLGVITLIGVGIRLLIMQTVQQRRERENRQINERLRTLIAAYKILGGSFTGSLAVDPAHLRDLRRNSGGAGPALAAGRGSDAGSAFADTEPGGAVLENEWSSSDRSRRIRDAVEAALSDVILLGTEEQVLLAADAARDLAEGRPTHTALLVVSLRDFIRQVLDLDPVPSHLTIPQQGPARPAARGGSGNGKDADKDATKHGGKGGAAEGGGAGMGAGMGLGVGLGGHSNAEDEAEHHP
jgi:heme exporter protein D